MADAFENFHPPTRLGGHLGSGGDGSEKNEDQNKSLGNLRQGLLSPPAKVIEWSKFGRES